MATPPAADPLAQPTRARLFSRLAELRRPATTEELAREVRLHVNGVRRHLERLEADGLLERRTARRGRGRPRAEWALRPGAAQERPRRYRDVARWLARAAPRSRSHLREVERTGREIGRELVAETPRQPARDFRDALAALGFEPELELREGGEVRCSLANCPYVESVQENPELVCTLHRGITAGLLERLAPGATLTRWEPHDPERAGCIADASGTGWSAAEIELAANAS